MPTHLQHPPGGSDVSDYTDEQLSQLVPLTLHDKWGIGGFHGGYGAMGDDFRCMCDFCRAARREYWENHQQRQQQGRS
jgi:hypothetical protein